MTELHNSSASGTANPVPVAGTPQPTATQVAALQSMWTAMNTLSQGQVSSAPSAAPAAVPAPAPAPVLPPPTGFFSGPPWVVGNLYRVIPEAALERSEHPDGNGDWYCITRGTYVGITLSNPLALAAVTGVPGGFMKGHKTQSLALDAFNTMLLFNKIFHLLGRVVACSGPASRGPAFGERACRVLPAPSSVPPSGCRSTPDKDAHHHSSSFPTQPNYLLPFFFPEDLARFARIRPDSPTQSLPPLRMVHDLEEYDGDVEFLALLQAHRSRYPTYIGLSHIDLGGAFASSAVAFFTTTSTPRFRFSNAPPRTPSPPPRTPSPPPPSYVETTSRRTFPCARPRTLYYVESPTRRGITHECCRRTQGVAGAHVHASPRRKKKRKPRSVAYVVFCGKKCDVFLDWSDAKQYVDGVSNAIYRGYASETAAHAAFNYARERSWTRLSTNVAVPIAVLPQPLAESNPISASEDVDDVWYLVYRGICPGPGVYRSLLECQLNTLGVRGASQQGIVGREAAFDTFARAVARNDTCALPPTYYEANDPFT
ncbi:hypothetical protein C8R47DRAFT_1327810 [Mycena vitilis]|nr:hypothetical protein C8R47DRAFT_1327810 [Mycena vitilis]